MDAKERALQIKLAQIQTHIQTYLALCIAFFAVAGASIIGEWQTLVSPPTDPTWLKGLAIGVFIILMTVFLVLTFVTAKRADSYIKELNSLV